MRDPGKLDEHDADEQRHQTGTQPGYEQEEEEGREHQEEINRAHD
jgi:hypothetical protein